MGKDEPLELGQWHVDDDLFVHYLDSPENALLVVSDIRPSGVATSDGFGRIARYYLAAHPGPRGHHLDNLMLCLSPLPGTHEDCAEHPGRLTFLEEAPQRRMFMELTGTIGDVVLMPVHRS